MEFHLTQHLVNLCVYVCVFHRTEIVCKSHHRIHVAGDKKEWGHEEIHTPRALCVLLDLAYGKQWLKATWMWMLSDGEEFALNCKIQQIKLKCTYITTRHACTHTLTYTHKPCTNIQRMDEYALYFLQNARDRQRQIQMSKNSMSLRRSLSSSSHDLFDMAFHQAK